MSTLVTTKNTGTFRARATPMCSLHIPTIPAKVTTEHARCQTCCVFLTCRIRQSTGIMQGTNLVMCKAAGEDISLMQCTTCNVHARCTYNKAYPITSLTAQEPADSCTANMTAVQARHVGHSRRWGSQQTCIGPHNQASIVWHVACQAIGGGLEVALVAGQIHQGHHLGRPGNVLSRGVAAEHLVVQDVALAVQLHTSRSADQRFVLVAAVWVVSRAALCELAAFLGIRTPRRLWCMMGMPFIHPRRHPVHGIPTKQDNTTSYTQLLWAL